MKFDFRRPEVFTGTGSWALGPFSPSLVTWHTGLDEGNGKLTTTTRQAAQVIPRDLPKTWTA